MIRFLSVIVPAFNEAARLPRFLASMQGYFDGNHGCPYEVIVVDDGSTDFTADVVRELAASWPQLRLVGLKCNSGKGAAIRLGFEHVRGDWALVADADGATPICELSKLQSASDSGADVAIGSRLSGSSGVRRARLRGLTGRLFAFAVSVTFGMPIWDTQCGFKLFRRDVGRDIVRACQENGYLIDLEVLLHARRNGLKVVEVPVEWQDVPGSKVHLFRDGMRMVGGLWRLRRRFRAFERRKKLSARFAAADVCTSPNVGTQL